MKYILINFLFLINLFLFNEAGAQIKELKLEEAITIGLKNNFSILIAEKDKEIAINNNTLGNAGFLPTLDANGRAVNSYLSGKTEDAEGVSVATNNNISKNVNLGLSFNWTLFDGFGMFIQKEKLNVLQKSGETAMRASIENVLSEIIVSYFAIVQNVNRLKVLDDAINFSLRRKDLTMKKFQIGLSSELAYLQTVTDLNADSVAFLKQQAELRNSKAELNLLMIADPATDFEVSDTILFNQILEYRDLIQKLPLQNSQMDLSRQNIEIAKLNYRLTHSPKYPRLDFFTNYNMIRNHYDYGLTRMNSSYGPAVGVNLSYPVFDGFNRRRNSANALIQSEKSKYQLYQTTKDLETTIFQQYNEYRNNLKLINFEKENLKITQRNTYVAFEKYRLGELSDIDLRQIQLNQLQAENSLLLAQFQAKQIETELLRLSGQLLQER